MNTPKSVSGNEEQIAPLRLTAKSGRAIYSATVIVQNAGNVNVAEQQVNVGNETCHDDSQSASNGLLQPGLLAESRPITTCFN